MIWCYIIKLNKTEMKQTEDPTTAFQSVAYLSAEHTSFIRTVGYETRLIFGIQKHTKQNSETETLDFGTCHHPREVHMQNHCQAETKCAGMSL